MRSVLGWNIVASPLPIPIAAGTCNRFLLGFPHNFVQQKPNPRWLSTPSSSSSFSSNSNMEGSDQELTKTIQQDESKKKGEEGIPSPARKILDPPEKPLPGDCCGSGCVRCVWDVYYDELEEYNKSLTISNQ